MVICRCELQAPEALCRREIAPVRSDIRIFCVNRHEMADEGSNNSGTTHEKALILSYTFFGEGAFSHSRSLSAAAV